MTQKKQPTKPRHTIPEAKCPVSMQSPKVQEKAPQNPGMATGETGNPECLRCTVVLECRAMWKGSHRKKSAKKPNVVASIVRFAFEHGAEMVCLGRGAP